MVDQFVKTTWRQTRSDERWREYGKELTDQPAELDSTASLASPHLQEKD